MLDKYLLVKNINDQRRQVSVSKVGSFLLSFCLFVLLFETVFFSLCICAWSTTQQRSPSLCLPKAGIKGMYHLCPAEFVILKIVHIYFWCIRMILLFYLKYFCYIYLCVCLECTSGGQRTLLKLILSFYYVGSVIKFRFSRLAINRCLYQLSHHAAIPPL